MLYPKALLAYLSCTLKSLHFIGVLECKPHVRLQTNSEVSSMPEFPIRKAKWVLIRSDFSSSGCQSCWGNMYIPNLKCM